MNAIQKMQKEGTLITYAEDTLQNRLKCPSYYGLYDKCEGDHAVCWVYALTKDYEGGE